MYGIPSMYGIWYMYLHLVDFYGKLVGKYTGLVPWMDVGIESLAQNIPEFTKVEADGVAWLPTGVAYT